MNAVLCVWIRPPLTYAHSPRTGCAVVFKMSGGGGGAGVADDSKCATQAVRLLRYLTTYFESHRQKGCKQLWSIDEILEDVRDMAQESGLSEETTARAMMAAKQQAREVIRATKVRKIAKKIRKLSDQS